MQKQGESGLRGLFYARRQLSLMSFFPVFGIEKQYELKTSEHRIRPHYGAAETVQWKMYNIRLNGAERVCLVVNSNNVHVQNMCFIED